MVDVTIMKSSRIRYPGRFQECEKANEYDVNSKLLFKKFAYSYIEIFVIGVLLS